MPLKTFVARKGLESGGGVYFKSKSIATSDQLSNEDFFVDCQYAGGSYDVYLPTINNFGEQRQIVVLRNSTGDTTNLVTVYGYSGGSIDPSTPFIYLKNGQTITFQVNSDYTGWFMTADYSFIQEDVAVGSTYRILNGNSATGPYSTVSGGAGNIAGIYDAAVPFLHGQYSTISGGLNNLAKGDYSTVAGGWGNIAGDPTKDDQTQREYVTVSGGYQNTAVQRAATVSGGRTNTVVGGDSVISGGQGNYIGGVGLSSISGGGGNYIGSASSNISGGGSNGITGSSDASSVGGGASNVITDSIASVISGGSNNTINTNTGSYNLISGGFSNQMNSSGIGWSNILGGNSNKITSGNYVVMSGGNGNTGGGTSSVLSGGEYNQNTGNWSVLSGGSLNLNNSQYSTISGGQLNRISSNGDYNVISGGYGNTAGIGGAGQTYSVISGGQLNYVVGQASSIVGGASNSIGTSTTHSFIGGGLNNSIATSASYSSILGGARNTVSGSVLRSSIIGGTGNTVNHNDSFVIGSSLASKRTDTTHVDNLDVNTTLSYNNYKSTAYSSGEVVYFGTTVSGVGMTAGFVYEYGGTGAWGIARADTSSNANGLLAIALGSAPSSGMLLRGFASYAAVSSYTAMGTTGGPVYLSKTANQFTQTAPGTSGDIVRIIGYCVNPTLDLLYFAPDTTWITLIS